ncbi:MAG: hypothetical protein JXB32_00430 [Deltaproteobacteria bacterium]|nr:hypothetical protein [Deltaproteobacteria bacterium]
MRLRSGFVVAVVGLACGSCSSPPSSGDTPDVSCTYESCRARCLAMGREYGSCGGGICHCTEDGDADADADLPTDGDDGPVRDDAQEAEDVASPCDGIRVPVEERAGASTGVTCRRLSVEEVEPHLMYYSGDGEFVALLGGEDRPRPLWILSRPTWCLRVLDDASVPGLSETSAGESSIEGNRIAYYVAGVESATALDVWQLRLVEIAGGEPRILVETRSERRSGQQASMDFPTLHYPWITWRDIRQANAYRWLAYAYNVETGEERNLSRNPDSGAIWATVMVDNDGQLAVFTGTYVEGTYSSENVVTVNLVTGDRGYLVPNLATQDWPSITSDWIVWLDQRTHPECDYVSPCYTDVYGYHRATGEVVPLVVAGDSMQGPWMDARGEWVAYEDQRDGTDVTRSLDREQDIYALHLPTRTEVRITDWPGFEWNPQVYDRHDGTFGLLLIEEIEYLHRIYRLWDCDLPEPAGGT